LNICKKTINLLFIIIEGFLILKKNVMKKVKEFLKEYMDYIVFVLVLIIFLKTCKTNGKIENVEKKLNTTTQKVDSLSINLNTLNKDLTKEIKLEGLKSEKRMIQSTDRKILDVNRQSEIDKEITNLEK
jgi:hypothetical protein